MASPFEQAWMLLKDSMDYGEIADGLSEPNPLDVALARARNQGPAPGANLKRLPPRLGTGSIEEMDIMMQQGGGKPPLGKPVPRPPVRPELAAKLTPQTALETDPSNAEVRPVYNEIGRIIGFEDAR